MSSLKKRERFYDNPYILQPGRLPNPIYIANSLRDRFTEAIRTLCDYITANIHSAGTSNLSIYSGLSGVLFARLRLQKHPDLLEKCQLNEFYRVTDELLQDVLERRDESTARKNISAFTSKYTGPCLIGALAGGENAAEFADEFMKCCKHVGWSMPDEALYGRVGYLAGLLLLKEAGFAVPVARFSRVVSKILKSGRNMTYNIASQPDYYAKIIRGSNMYGREERMPPLFFQWHDKYYLGAAHGFAGILFLLMRVHEEVPSALERGVLEEVILPTTKWLAQLQFDSGNWPSSLGESVEKNNLVQWCHGASGIVPLMLKAYQLTGDDEYLARAKNGGEDIWERGFLKKGCGLCHGTAGSGYALLSLYHVTRDQLYLRRAAAFAELCTNYFKNAKRPADRPLSLFEGVSGAIVFLADMLDPENAKFPLMA